MNALIKKLEGDKVLWMITLLLSIISVLAVYSSISTLAYKADGNSLKFLLKHTFMIGIGLFIMYHVHKMNYTYLSKVAKVFIWVAGILLLATLLFGVDINNAKRWLRVPGMGLTFQTSDFAKIVLILYTARMLSIKRLVLHNFKEGVLPVLYPIVIICALILPADLSTAVLLGLICFIMMIIAGVPWKHLFKIIGAAIGVIFIIYLIGSSMPDVFPRFATWTSRINGFFLSTDGPNYQIDHALYAIHDGGFLPNSIGSGSSRNFMPHPYSDTIFAFIIQEYGSIIGGAFLILGYIILLFRSIKIGVKCPKNFGAMTAIGLSLMLVIQAFINMGVAVNLIPTTGQPLPLVSMGGTSMIFTCITIGIILSISRTVYGDVTYSGANDFSKNTIEENV